MLIELKPGNANAEGRPIAPALVTLAWVSQLLEQWPEELTTLGNTCDNRHCPIANLIANAGYDTYVSVDWAGTTLSTTRTYIPHSRGVACLILMVDGDEDTEDKRPVSVSLFRSQLRRAISRYVE